jgi:hypothetical protein
VWFNAKREAARVRAERMRDLDETRRLLYMALLVGKGCERPELVATLVNAILHHGSVRHTWTPEQVEAILETAVGAASAAHSEPQLRVLIESCSRALQEQ